MKRMLVNATQPEELRVAIVDGQKLDNLDIEHKTREQKKSNIYKATITRVEPSLEAAFVDYGADRQGFLPFKEIAKEFIAESARKDGGRPNVKAGIKEGQKILVQIEKEERGTKGAALTTFASLAGRFLVLMPNNPRAGGVSRRIEGEERADLKSAMNELDIPDGMGIIVRTAGVGRSAEELQWDLDYQIKIWEAIQDAGEKAKAPSLIYQESNVIVRALRDYFRGDIGEILVDEPEVYTQAQTFMSQYLPQHMRKLKLYNEDVPLFNRYQIEGRIESAFQREVRLPSGGAIVIDHTEALISIDINSARATKGSDIEETATNTNLEACDEVGRQLRLRDLGGLVVIDFIDMMVPKNQRQVENRLRDVVKIDRARVQIGRISRFGLMEMSRQRLRPSLGESSEIVCPRCVGQGTIRTVESLALQLLRLLEEETLKENTGRVLIKVPVPVATYLLNEKRETIREIEERNNAKALLVPDLTLDTPHYEIERIRTNETDHQANQSSSHELATTTTTTYTPAADKAEIIQSETAAVQTVAPPSPIPQPAANTALVSGNKKGFISRIMSVFSSAETEQAEEEKPVRNRQPRKNNRNQKSNQRRGRGQRNNQQDDTRRNNKQNNNQNNNQSNNQNNKKTGQGNNANNNSADSKSAGNRSQNQTGQQRNNNRRNQSGKSAGGQQQSRNQQSKDQQQGQQQNKQAGEAVTEQQGSKTDNRQQRSSQSGNRNQNRRNRNNNQKGSSQQNEKQTPESASSAPAAVAPPKPVEPPRPKEATPAAASSDSSTDKRQTEHTATAATPVNNDSTASVSSIQSRSSGPQSSGTQEGSSQTEQSSAPTSAGTGSNDHSPNDHSPNDHSSTGHSSSGNGTTNNQSNQQSKSNSSDREQQQSGNRSPRSRYNRRGRRNSKQQSNKQSPNQSNNGNNSVSQTQDAGTPAPAVQSSSSAPKVAVVKGNGQLSRGQVSSGQNSSGQVSGNKGNQKPDQVTTHSSEPSGKAPAEKTPVASVANTTHLEPKLSSSNSAGPKPQSQESKPTAVRPSSVPSGHSQSNNAQPNQGQSDNRNNNQSGNLKQVETSRSGQMFGGPSEVKNQVSAIQPSQLKSSVRSLASNKDSSVKEDAGNNKSPGAKPKPETAPKLQKIETTDHGKDHS